MQSFFHVQKWPLHYIVFFPRIACEMEPSVFQDNFPWVRVPEIFKACSMTVLKAECRDLGLARC